jgi:hypothetical protein
MLTALDCDTDRRFTRVRAKTSSVIFGSRGNGTTTASSGFGTIFNFGCTGFLGCDFLRLRLTVRVRRFAGAVFLSRLKSLSCMDEARLSFAERSR